MCTPSIEIRRECREIASTRIREGFSDRDEIVESVTDMVSDEYEVDAAVIAELVNEVFAEHLREQASWPSPTDCERLDQAFDALQQGGIVARQNFWCCQTCALDAIEDEMAFAEDADVPVRGYVYYHEQDTEGAVELGRLFLGYGAVEPEDDAAVAVGHEIVAQLSALGLKCDWNGDIAERIVVKIDWKRRRGPSGEALKPETAIYDG